MESLKYHITTFGCQMNLSDSERIATVLERLKYQHTPSEEGADLVVYNTCSIRQKAEDRIFGKRKEWQQMKASNPGLVLALTGCMVGHQSYNFKRVLPELDIVFDINDLPRLHEQLASFHDIDPTVCYNQDYFDVLPKLTSRFQVSVPIMKGCDNFCTFCIVPFSRGREQSRPVSDVVNEVKALVDQGALEVLLLGQNVNSYLGYLDAALGRSSHLSAKQEQDRSKVANFAELLHEVNKVAGLKRIRFTSPHPKDFSDEMIDAIATLDKVAEHVHLPVQAGNNEVLRRMNRHYTHEEYLALVEKIRARIPGVAITTDIIVGFCGETREQFEDSLRLFREVEFDQAYIAMYSSRPKTAAYKVMKDDVPFSEKRQRWSELNEVLSQTALSQNKKYLGEDVEVLVEQIGEGARKHVASGRTRTNKLVKFQLPQTSRVEIGDLVNVKVTEVKEWVLEGKEKSSAEAQTIRTGLPVVYA